MKKIIPVSIVIILLFFNTIPLVNSENNESLQKVISSEIFDENSEIFIQAENPYDYGLKAGQQYRLQFKILEALARLTKKDKINEEEINDQISDLEKYSPFLLEELRGLSTSLNINLEKIFSIMKVASFLFEENRCTTTLSTGSATKENDTFLTQNFDSSSVFTRLYVRFFSYKTKIVRINTIKYRYAFIGIPIIYELPLLNEKGLGFGGNGLGLTKNESRYIDEGPGISTYMLERLSMMTCSNVSEVAELWKNSERASGTYRDWPHFWDNSISVWCDREGGILMIEQTHNYILTVFGNSTDITGGPKDILWHANLHQWLDPNLTGSMFREESASSPPRSDRAYELLVENYGNITIDVLKSITRDHGGGSDKNARDSYDLCRHPDKNASSTTIISWITQPKEMTVYLTHRAPCRSRFIKHDFSTIFA